jgi:multiple sugar transport system permease protein
MRRRVPAITVLQYIVSWGLALVFIFPIVWMLFTSLKWEGYPIKYVSQWFLPPFTLQNYATVFRRAPIGRWMWNSVFVASVVTILVLLFSSLAAFAISQIKFRYRTFIYLFFMAGLMVPGEATIIPLFNLANNLNLINTYRGLIFPALAGPFSVIILKEFFDGIPRDLVDAARIDGCGLLRMFWVIFLPLSKPALSTIAIFTFVGNWNSFLWPFLITVAEKMYTLPVGVPAFNSNYSQDYILPMTVNAVASLPAIVAFLLFQKQIIRGIRLTGLKG